MQTFSVYIAFQSILDMIVCVNKVYFACLVRKIVLHALSELYVCVKTEVYFGFKIIARGNVIRVFLINPVVSVIKY